jgi:hypothetical protein
MYDRKSFARQVLLMGYRLRINREQWSTNSYDHLVERVIAFRIGTTNVKR